MPKISLWNPKQGREYQFMDRVGRENTNMGGTGVHVHRYMGPRDNEGNPTDPLTIGDVLFLENRSRVYDSFIYELRGAYQPPDGDFDLSQFGIFLSDDTVRVTFHLNDMVDKIGRKLMPGDVLELPHLREYFSLDAEKPAVNRYYVVEDGNYPREGFGPRWWNHFWRVKAKMITGSPEYEDILGQVVGSDGTVGPNTSTDECCVTIGSLLSDFNQSLAVTDGVVNEASSNVEFDPVWFNASHLYVGTDQDGKPALRPWNSSSGTPPNGELLSGSGTSFPDSLEIGDYFLRLDFSPPQLYQKQTDCRFVRIETDMSKLPWTAANRVLDSFLENVDQVVNPDNTVVPSRQALSQAIKPKPQSDNNQ